MKQKKKIQKREYPKLSELRRLYKEGCSVKTAMRLAGYSESTIQKKAWWYTKQLDMDELLRGLETKAALSSFKAFRILDDKMESENESSQIRAADAVLRSGKTYLRKKESPTTLVWAFQTFQKVEDKQQKEGEIIDVGKEPPKDD